MGGYGQSGRTDPDRIQEAAVTRTAPPTTMSVATTRRHVIFSRPRRNTTDRINTKMGVIRMSGAITVMGPSRNAVQKLIAAAIANIPAGIEAKKMDLSNRNFWAGARKREVVKSVELATMDEMTTPKAAAFIASIPPFRR